jgi:hypothetical protein
MRAFIVSVFVLTLFVSMSAGQSPIPVVVPAMTPATNAQSPAAAAVTATATQTTLKALQAIKAANDEILKQQAATLEKLDEMEKIAQDMRIFSKRG